MMIRLEASRDDKGEMKRGAEGDEMEISIRRETIF